MAVPATLWPTTEGDRMAYAAMRESLRTPLASLLQRMQIPEGRLENLYEVCLPLAIWIRAQKRASPLSVGISGAQGSGKSTLAQLVGFILAQVFHYRVASLSLDDLYLTRAERIELARAVHPLLVTRGVPGTHDTGLALAVLDALRCGTPRQVTRLPSFDKAADERRPQTEWPAFTGQADVVILEGWCVGAGPQEDSALRHPVNPLEAEEDADGAWRRYVNDQLAASYAALFATLDRLVFLRVPDMESVYRWRSLQEEKLAAALAETGRHHRLMDDVALRRFIMHFERLSRAMLVAMPRRADVTLSLDRHHQFTDIQLLH